MDFKKFCTVVVLEKENILSGRLKVTVTGVKYRSKRPYIELVRDITGTFIHGFQNNFAQLLSSRRKSAI